MIDDWRLTRDSRRSTLDQRRGCRQDQGLRRLHKWVVAVMLVLLVWLALPGAAIADVDLPVLFAQQEGEAVQIQPEKKYTLETLILIVVVGGALYSICRSSRRS